MYRINLTVKPIWLRQDEELDDQYRAFCDYRDGEYVSAKPVCDKWTISHEVPHRNRWQERADAHHEEVGRVMGKSIGILKERLQLTAIEAAFAMMRERTAMDTTKTVKHKDDEGRVHINTATRKTLSPSERIVSQVLDYVMKEGDAKNNDEISELLRAMVQDTDEGGDASADTGLA